MAPDAAVTIDAREDAELMRRVQSGDQAALGALMERWELPVKSVVGRIVLNASEAEEIAQEAFVRVWQQRDKYIPDAPFKPWLFAIAVNLARNRLRWWRRRPEVSLDEWTETPAEGPIGENVAERAERAAAVRDAIASLPTDLREAIVLFEYQHLSHAEISTALGTTPKAVENRIHRARERLRVVLKPMFGSPT